ncbi:MAG: glycosyltransferase [Bacteroidota bacterium]
MNKTALLIPHYNNPEGLIASLNSIHPEEHIDVVIVDDGSAIKFDENAINTAFKAQGNIRFIYLPQNKGIEHAMNTGAKQIVKDGYTYMARLDCGDTCIGKRFYIQETYMESHPDVKLVGSNVIAVDMQGNFLYNIKMPSDYSSIKKRMYLNAMFIHPTVMFNAQAVHEAGYYSYNYKSAEDYALFFSIVNKYQAVNVDEFLVKIEINPGGISLSRRKQQVASRIKVILHHFYFGFYPIYGLLRNAALYVMPLGIIQFLKRKSH